MKIKKIVTIFLILLISLIPISTKIQSSNCRIETQFSFEEKDLSSWWWEPLELLSAEFDTTNYLPDIVIDAENNIHVITYAIDDILGAGGDRDVFYRKYDYVLKSWTDLELVSEGSGHYSEIPQMAVDSSGTVHIAWREGDSILGSGVDADIFYRQKTSSGWSSVEVVSTESDDSSTFLSVVADSNGVCHIVWEDQSDYLVIDGDQDIFYKYRTAAGVWSSAEIVSDLSTEDTYDPFIQLDNQENLLIAWTDYTNILGAGVGDLDVFYRQLDNDLSTWSSIKLMSSESSGTSRNPRISVSSDDSIHLVWNDYTDYLSSGVDSDIFYKRYNLGSDSWSISEVISTESTDHSIEVEVDIDSSDYLYLIWQDSTDVGGAGNADNIFFKYLDLKTDVWSTQIILTYNHADTSLYPDLAVDSLGHVHVIFLDSDSNLLGSGIDVDVFYKKFVGVPMQPVLDEIKPNPAAIGDVYLSWSLIQDATNYEVFRETSFITSIALITPISSTNNSYYNDTVDSTGNYYYAIVATNEYGESSISNIELVEVIKNIRSGFFSSFDLSELLVFAGIVLGLQLIFSVLTYILISSKIQTMSKPGKGKKK